VAAVVVTAFGPAHGSPFDHAGCDYKISLAFLGSAYRAPTPVLIALNLAVLQRWPSMFA
jgi:hypothetical protein